MKDITVFFFIFLHFDGLTVRNIQKCEFRYQNYSNLGKITYINLFVAICPQKTLRVSSSVFLTVLKTKTTAATIDVYLLLKYF